MGPGRTGPPRCGIDARAGENLPYGAGAESVAESGELAVDAPMPQWGFSTSGDSRQRGARSMRRPRRGWRATGACVRGGRAAAEGVGASAESCRVCEGSAAATSGEQSGGRGAPSRSAASRTSGRSASRHQRIMPWQVRRRSGSSVPIAGPRAPRGLGIAYRVGRSPQGRVARVGGYLAGWAIESMAIVTASIRTGSWSGLISTP